MLLREDVSEQPVASRSTAMAKVVSADEAVRLIPDGATMLVVPTPAEEVYPAFYRAFSATGSPKNLTMVWAAGLGPLSFERKGMNHFGYPGMVKRIIAGHIGLNYEVVKLIAMNQIEAYNIPQGTLCQLYREIAAHRCGVITRVGLGTFVDPRIEGGKLNERTKACEDLVEVLQIDGQDMLRYKPFTPNVGLIRGTTADPEGNITIEEEALCMENLDGAMAVRNCGGIVIAQVQRLSDVPACPHDVRIPGVFVDYVVVASTPQNHPQTLFVQHDPSYAGKTRVDLEKEFKPMPLNAEKVIARRAAMELAPRLPGESWLRHPHRRVRGGSRGRDLRIARAEYGDRRAGRAARGRQEFRPLQESQRLSVADADV